MNGITVADLIDFLSTQDPKAQIAFKQYSDQRLMYLDDIEVIKGCFPRNDGWVQNARPDKAQQTYILFPGN